MIRQRPDGGSILSSSTARAKANGRRRSCGLRRRGGTGDRYREKIQGSHVRHMTQASSNRSGISIASGTDPLTPLFPLSQSFIRILHQCVQPSPLNRTLPLHQVFPTPSPPPPFSSFFLPSSPNPIPSLTHPPHSSQHSNLLPQKPRPQDQAPHSTPQPLS